MRAKHPKNSTTLLSEVKDFLSPDTAAYIGNGYITFGFGIDCEDKREGWLRVLQPDEQYDPIYFDKIFFYRLKCIFKKDYEGAIVEFDNPLKIAQYSYKVDHTYPFHLGLCYLGLKDYAQSKLHFERCCDADRQRFE